jgi:hypothetical protein
MDMAHTWSLLGFLATSLVAMVATMFRSMSIHRRQLTDSIDTAVAGLRSEVHTGLDGLRNEMIARFEHVVSRLDKAETIDREVHALSLRMFGQEGPPSAK